MTSIPNDPAMLLSYINTQLRDFYPSLKELCKTVNISEEMIVNHLKQIDYTYDVNKNQFV